MIHNIITSIKVYQSNAIKNRMYRLYISCIQTIHYKQTQEAQKIKKEDSKTRIDG